MTFYCVMQEKERMEKNIKRQINALKQKTKDATQHYRYIRGWIALTFTITVIQSKKNTFLGF